MYKGGIKIFLIFLIILIMIISAVMFGFDQHGDVIKEHVQETAENAMEQGGQKVAEKIVEEGKEKIGETLKEAGEKILYEKFDEPGYYGEYDTDVMNDYERVVLFFTTEWCPSCKDAEGAIDKKKAYISPDIAIMTVNFDDDMLKEEYSITKQHTFILLDSDKNEIKRWTNSTSLEDVIYNTK